MKLQEMMQEVKRNILNLLEPYSSEIIRRYMESLNVNEDMQQHPWMREELMQSELYSCSINGKTVTLEELIFGDISVSTRQNIIIVTGEKHIGKKYFTQKLMETCKESVEREKSPIHKAVYDGNYRIPVLIPYEWYCQRGSNLSLAELIVKVIEEQCDSYADGRKSAQFLSSVDKLLRAGRFFIYLEGKQWLRELEEDMKKLLDYGRIIENYDVNAKFHNLVILTLDSEGELKETFINENLYISIKLKKLEIQEVKAYLKKHLPDVLKIVESNDEILEMLREPEHLKMFEALYDDKLIKEDDKVHLSNDFDFYDYFIRSNIRKKLKETEKPEKAKGAENRNRENAIFNELEDHAVRLYLYGNVVRRDPSRYFSFDDFEKVGLLRENGDFAFPLCGYYLVTEYLLQELRNDRLNEIPDCLLEEPLEIILLWFSKRIDELEQFWRFWNIMCKKNSCKLLLLAKIAKETEFRSEFMNDVYEKAFENLQQDFYDYTVLEAFKELEDDGTYLSKKYLSLDEYEEVKRNNIKKRVVYFLGISHSGIIGKMLDELMEEKTDLHLKYHIIRAAVENYGEHEKSTGLLEKRMEELKAYCGLSEDPILKSDFGVLYQKCMGKAWSSAEEEFKLVSALKEKMDDKVYWVRAHAAGAIGRRNIFKACPQLLGRISCELDQIYEKRDDYRNSIKVISYSVEALCEVSNEQVDAEEKNAVIGHLVELLDMDKLGDPDVEDAYSTIATGIEYMINADTEKLPFNLGGRFRNHTISYQKVLYNVFQELVYTMEDHREILESIKGKRKRLEQIMSAQRSKGAETLEDHEPNVIRMLQLSDWHFKNGNSDNTLIVKALKKLKGIDLLVITGDLRDYREDYSYSLELLNELVSALGLGKEDVFMVPGNHDCQEFADKEQIFQEIRDGIWTDKECYRKHLDKLYLGLDKYEKFIRDFYGEKLISHGGLHNCMNLWKEKLYILTMNTSLLSDRNSEMDKIVDIAELAELKRERKLPVFCISHHKFSDIYLDHQKSIKTVLEDLKVTAMLSGDVHQSMVEMIRINPGTIKNYICGKLMGDTNDNWSVRSFGVYDIHLDDQKFTADSFQWNGSKFQQDMAFWEAPSGNDDPTSEWKKTSEELLI